jgi:L-threonylcarbamoyladenylate synthase
VTPRNGRRWQARTAAERTASVPLAVAHLRGGGLLAYPTETVYGLGARVTDAGVTAVQAMKGRGPGAPFLALLPWTEGGVEELRIRAPWGAALGWTKAAVSLAAEGWPGPLTLILEDRTGSWPAGVRNERGGVGVRVSPHPFVRDLLDELDEPLLSTSANPTGEAAAHSADEVEARLRGRPGWNRCRVVDAGPLPPSLPSTMVDCTGNRPRLLREGAFPLDTLQNLINAIHE